MEVSVSYAETPDGIRIAYTAQGRGAPVVLMPNLPVSHLTLHDQVPERQAFARQLSSRRSVVRYDSRGTGLSTWQTDGFSLEAYTADLESVVDELRLERFALYAGYYATPVALSYAASHPRRVSHLVLFHPFARTRDFWEGSSEMPLLNGLLGRSWTLHTRATSCSVYGWQESDKALRQAEIMQRSITPETYARSLEVIGEFDVRSELSRVSAPALLLQRRSCDLFAPHLGRDLARRLPNARLQTLAGSSGSLYSGDVRSYADLILDFLAEEQPTAATRLEAPGAGLTNRETEILRLLTGGLRSKEIGRLLGISVHTVERHIANIYGKTGTKGRAGAAVYAIRSGLV